MRPIAPHVLPPKVNTIHTYRDVLRGTWLQADSSHPIHVHALDEKSSKQEIRLVSGLRCDACLREKIRRRDSTVLEIKILNVTLPRSSQVPRRTFTS